MEMNSSTQQSHHYRLCMEALAGYREIRTIVFAGRAKQFLGAKSGTDG